MHHTGKYCFLYIMIGLSPGDWQCTFCIGAVKKKQNIFHNNCGKDNNSNYCFVFKWILLHLIFNLCGVHLSLCRQTLWVSSVHFLIIPLDRVCKILFWIPVVCFHSLLCVSTFCQENIDLRHHVTHFMWLIFLPVPLMYGPIQCMILHYCLWSAFHLINCWYIHCLSQFSPCILINHSFSVINWGLHSCIPHPLLT